MSVFNAVALEDLYLQMHRGRQRLKYELDRQAIDADERRRTLQVPDESEAALRRQMQQALAEIGPLCIPYPGSIGSFPPYPGTALVERPADEKEAASIDDCWIDAWRSLRAENESEAAPSRKMTTALDEIRSLFTPPPDAIGSFPRYPSVPLGADPSPADIVPGWHELRAEIERLRAEVAALKAQLPPVEKPAPFPLGRAHQRIGMSWNEP